VELGSRFPLALHGFVAAVGGDAVLKVTPAVYYETDHEGDALAHWAGHGAARLLRHDRERRVLLLERARHNQAAHCHCIRKRRNQGANEDSRERRKQANSNGDRRAGFDISGVRH